MKERQQTELNCERCFYLSSTILKYFLGTLNRGLSIFLSIDDDGSGHLRHERSQQSQSLMIKRSMNGTLQQHSWVENRKKEEGKKRIWSSFHPLITSVTYAPWHIRSIELSTYSASSVLNEICCKLSIPTTVEYSSIRELNSKILYHIFLPFSFSFAF